MGMLVTAGILIGFACGIGYWLSGTSPQKTAAQLGRNGFAAAEDSDISRLGPSD